MSDSIAHAHHDTSSTDVFGFWLYIMTDCILFSTLFATFLVLNIQAPEQFTLKHYIELKDVLIETFFLLFSNFTFCLAALNLYQNKRFKTQFWLFMTIVFGLGFLFYEITEFMHFSARGFRWDLSGQASSFFTLVGTHGLHVLFGLLWIVVMILQLSAISSTDILKRRMTYLGLFWNFLDIVWIFLFSIVYLLGAI